MNANRRRELKEKEVFRLQRVLGGSFLEHVTKERIKTREAVGRVDVILDNVKSKIVGTTKGPDCQCEKKAGPESWTFNEQQGGRGQANKEEQAALEPDNFRVFEVSHLTVTRCRMVGPVLGGVESK